MAWECGMGERTAHAGAHLRTKQAGEQRKETEVALKLYGGRQMQGLTSRVNSVTSYGDSTH